MSWKISVLGSRKRVQAALLAHEEALDWDPDVVLSGCEIADDRPEEWVLEAWYAKKPTKADEAAVKALFSGRPPKLTVAKLENKDWVALSQQGIEPIRVGRFHVHTPDFPALAEPGVRDFAIPASQAFGTGQHATTAGCLEMLSAMKAQGTIARNIADIGTGTGLLAFAALELWPRALATASDIDPICVDVVESNAAANGIRLGAGRGALTMLVAPGMEHPLLEARGPYDLLIANILAGPLQELAADFVRAVVPGGSILLAGLLETQEAAVRQAYRLAGCRLAARLVKGDWAILWLRKRSGGRTRATRSSAMPAWSRNW